MSHRQHPPARCPQRLRCALNRSKDWEYYQWKSYVRVTYFVSVGRFFLTKLGIEPGLTSVVVTWTHERFYMSMADLISVEAAITWRWRCQSEGIVVFGPDLRVAESPETSRLAEWRSPEIDREKLRCACGSRVLPLAPIDIK